jgi:hypothetical protein
MLLPISAGKRGLNLHSPLFWDFRVIEGGGTPCIGGTREFMASDDPR